MYVLLEECFENTDWSTFLKDLQDKDEVLMLHNAQGALCGFTTLTAFRHSSLGREYRVVFSGDTVIAPAYWGSAELAIAWGAHLMQRLSEEPETPLLWLLISKGIRTFKFLPVFFKSYYPNPAAGTPKSVQQLMDELGGRRFGAQYEAASGLVRAAAQSYYLRPELAVVQPGSRRRPYIEHFYRKNPDWRSGSELLCLTEFSPENLRSFILRHIAARLGEHSYDRSAA